MNNVVVSILINQKLIWIIEDKYVYLMLWLFYRIVTCKVKLVDLTIASVTVHKLQIQYLICK